MKRVGCVPGFGEADGGLPPVLKLELERALDPVVVGLALQLGAGVALLESHHQLDQLFRLPLGFPQPVDHVELLPGLGVHLKLQLRNNRRRV